MDKKLKNIGKKIKKLKINPKAGGLLATLFILGLILALAGAVLVVALIAGLIAYAYHPKKPSLDLAPEGLQAIPSAVF